jgi:hypothetical protein
LSRTKHVFVLDENILIQSNNCKSVNGSKDDYDSLELVINILKRCHRIGLSDELIAKYRKWLKKLEKERYVPAVRLWNWFLNNKRKHVLCSNHINNLPSGLKHDRHVIEPAFFPERNSCNNRQKAQEKMERMG